MTGDGPKVMLVRRAVNERFEPKADLPSLRLDFTASYTSVQSVDVGIRSLPCPFMMDWQGAPIKLHGPFWRTDHVWLFDIRKYCHISGALAAEWCDPVQ